MKTKMMMLLLVLLSWGAYAQHDHAAQGNEKKSDQSHVMFADEKTGMAYEHYIHLKDALVASNEEEAKKAAVQLQKALASVKGSKKTSDEAAKVAGVSSLDDQRIAFAGLSNEMAALIKGGKLSMGEVYLAYCPMANDGAGAAWLSNEKAIRNPYFGDKMLKCGAVKETIE